MPDFVAALAAAALFCTAVLILNALTRVGIDLHLAPAELAENGFAQYGPALVLSGLAWRRALTRSSH